MREDGGTPGFLQCIKTALAIKLKDAMGVENIQQREAQITRYVMVNLAKNKQVVMLEPNISERLAIVSFYVPGAHYNLVVRLLNDKFGVQTRGGCSCAGTYGHILLNVDQGTSSKITQQIDLGDFAEKPGWIRASFHPTTSDKEVAYVVDAINQVTENLAIWSKEYRFNPAVGDYEHCNLDVEYPNLSHFKALPETELITIDKAGEKNSILRKFFS
jgi:selenocysteine lyase/cysteine desulfurase